MIDNRLREAVPDLITGAVRRLPAIGETHWLKVALSLNRFATRYPHWDLPVFTEALERSEWFVYPSVEGPLYPRIAANGFTAAPARARRIIGRGLFPVAYLVARQWYEAEGLEVVIMAYKDRAIHEGTYLGHGWTVWCSFVELLPLLATKEQEALALERFIDFVGKKFPGYLSDNPNWEPPRQVDPGPIDAGEVLDLALERPGFFGHNLLTLAYLHRHRELLTPAEWHIGLATVRSMSAMVYIDPEDNVQFPAAEVPEVPVSEKDLEQAALHLILRGPRNAHSLTLADASHDLFAVADARQRRHLIHYLGTFAA